MRSRPVDRAIAGDALAPDAFNAEVAEMFATGNSLDHANFAPGAITAALLEPGAFGDFFFWGTFTAQNTVHGAEASPLFEYYVPDETGAPLRKTMTVGDGVVHVSLKATWRETTGNIAPEVWVGVRLDGELIAVSPVSDISTPTDNLLIMGAAPVGAGDRLFEVVYGVAEPDGGFTIEWGDRTLAILEVAR